MNEWYVYTEGGKPFEVVLGRMEAVRRILAPGGTFRTTPEEKKQISRFLEGNVCDLGGGLHLVGIVRSEHDEAQPDRKIIRVIGPGTEV